MNDHHQPVPVPATNELLALATRTRPDWSPHDLSDALAQARVQGMTWPAALVAVARLLADPDAQPHDLNAEVPEPWRRRRRTPGPDTAHRGAAAVRAALHTTPPEHH
ncbi:hypothetical protein ACFWPV_10165 [Streptomyces uncialis]|uniref:hypothetical protein n=1 Tax=Streptomyces uncialis TaxID=1048205 RepID=UPI00364A4539